MRYVLIVLVCSFGLAGCDDGDGHDQVNAQGVQKCTVTMHGKEVPCSNK